MFLLPEIVTFQNFMFQKIDSFRDIDSNTRNLLGTLSQAYSQCLQSDFEHDLYSAEPHALNVQLLRIERRICIYLSSSRHCLDNKRDHLPHSGGRFSRNPAMAAL